MRKRNETIKETLNQQVIEKHKKKEQENHINEEYMKKWITLTENDAMQRKMKEDQHKQQVLQVKDYLVMQMAGEGGIGSDKGSMLNYQKKKHHKEFGPMSAEEIKLNKQLL
jgi:C-terminal processing protease CtpA/Prc